MKIIGLWVFLIELGVKQEDDMAKERASKTYSPSKLVVPREEAIRKIREQIDLGRGLRDQKMFSMADLENAQKRMIDWFEINIQLLTRLFSNSFFKEEYSMGLSSDMDSAITFSLKEKYFKEDMNEQIGRLESFLERLKLIPEMKAGELTEQELVGESVKEEQPKEIGSIEVQLREALTSELKPREEPIQQRPSEELPSKEKPPKEELSRKVPETRKLFREEPPPTTAFDQSELPGGHILLIHGRDEATKKTVSEFIEKLGLRASILHEQPNEGRSIIEKFGEPSNIDFAIILFTPDDIATPRNKPKERQTRVSQNVIFEFGFVLGKLGQGRVCVLYKEGVEIPSDYSGVMTIPMDPRGGWRLLVAKEIKQAGIEIDLNKAI
jgi:predicted nucleotide-binding protein